MLEFSISNQLLTRLDSTTVYSGSCNYLRARFAFSDDWAGVVPVATFSHPAAEGAYSVRLIQGECLVPLEVLRPGRFSVTVCGAGGQTGVSHIPTGVVTITVEESGHSLDLAPQEPTPSLYDTLLSQLSAAEQEAERAAGESRAYLQGGDYQNSSGESQTVSSGVQALAAAAETACQAAQTAQQAAQTAAGDAVAAQTSAVYYAQAAQTAAQTAQTAAGGAEEATRQADRAKAYAQGGSYAGEDGTQQTVSAGAQQAAQAAEQWGKDAQAAAEQAATAAAGAATAAAGASQASSSAESAAQTAQVWAVGPGQTEDTPGPEQNSRYYAQVAQTAAQGVLDVSDHLEDWNNPHHVTPYQVGGIPILQTRYPPGWNEEEYGADGEFYELLLPEGMTLEAGMLVTVIFHKTSVTKDPYMVMGNPQRDYAIKRPGHWTNVGSSGPQNSWLAAEKPVLLQFTGDKFLTLGYPSIRAMDLTGTMQVADGGTGGTTAAAARANLGAARQYLYGATDPAAAGVTLEEGQLYFVYE